MPSTELEQIPDPWEKLETETSDAFFAFSEYCKLGPSRTLRKVSSHLGISHDSIKAYSRQNKWVERSKAYDIACNELVPTDQALSPTETLAHHYAVGRIMLDLGIKAINMKKPGTIKPSDAIKLISEGSKMQRDAMGMNQAGVNININAGSVDAVNDLINDIENAIEGEIVGEEEDE